MGVMKWLLSGLIVIVIYIGSVFWGGRVWAQGQSATLQIDYALAYPGILPDSPIYVLKVARDQLMLWAIRDTRQKAFYLTLLSDKRLAAGESLINKGRNDTGAISVLKAEEYFGQAVDRAIAAKKAGAETDDLFSKLTVSSAKHAEVIGRLLGKVSGKDAGLVVKARRENQNSSDRVREIFFQTAGLLK